MLKVTVSDIMSEDLVTISEEASVGQVAHILLRFRINGIIVVNKKDSSKMVGIITTTDLLKLLDKALSNKLKRVTELEKISKLPAKSIASKTVVKLQKDTKLERVIALMHRKNIHTIPIYDGAKLVGVVGRHDILNAAFI